MGKMVFSNYPSRMRCGKNENFISRSVDIFPWNLRLRNLSDVHVFLVYSFFPHCTVLSSFSLWREWWCFVLLFFCVLASKNLQFHWFFLFLLFREIRNMKLVGTIVKLLRLLWVRNNNRLYRTISLKFDSLY